MNSYSRACLLTLLLLGFTMPLKVLAPRAQVDMNSELKEKTVAIGQFLQQHGAVHLTSLMPNRSIPSWIGWHSETGHCQAALFPIMAGPDSLPAIRTAKMPGAQTSFIYEGQVQARYPLLQVGFDQVVSRMLWSVHPARWRRPLVVVVFHSGDCTELLGWDWSVLWRT